MGQRQKDWAKRVREKLLAELGGKCVVCGSAYRPEFDCIEPRGDAHHKFDTSHRMSFYRKEHKAGNLQVLCQFHNAQKSDTRKANQPF